jgi:hypothetical protein
VYALVSHMPGPLGSGDIQIFNSNHSPGVQGAVQWFTDPAFARQLTSKLRKPDEKAESQCEKRQNFCLAFLLR